MSAFKAQLPQAVLKSSLVTVALVSDVAVAADILYQSSYAACRTAPSCREVGSVV